MVLGMDTRFSETIANKFSLTSGDLVAQYPIWLPQEDVNAKLQLLLLLEPCKTPLIPFYLERTIQIPVTSMFYSYIKVKGHFQDHFSLKW